MSWRAFVRALCALLLAFVLLNAAIWNLYGRDLLTYQGGDVARLAYLPLLKQGSRLVTSVDLPRRHVEQRDHDGSRVDLITIGDSFSNGGPGGRNPYYQDHLASAGNLAVLNLATYENVDFITFSASLLDNGFFDRVRPRALLVSAAERRCVDDFAKELDFSNMPRIGDLEIKKSIDFTRRRSDVPFINTGNFMIVANTARFRFFGARRFGKIQACDLSAPLFTGAAPRTLFCYREDIEKAARATHENIVRMNDNFNALADRLASRKIRLFFMPCVDKYDVYHEFVTGNPAPKPDFFERLRPLPKRYTLVDTKAILSDLLRRGEKDVYFAEDTHWTWKASEAIARSFRLEE